MGQLLTDKEKGRLDDQLFQLREMTARGELPLGRVRRSLQSIIEGRFLEDAPTRGEAPDPELSLETFEKELGTRVVNTLARSYIFALGDLMEATEDEIRQIAGVGRSTQDALRDVLDRYGISFADPATRTGTPRWALCKIVSKSALGCLGFSNEEANAWRELSFVRVHDFINLTEADVKKQIRRRDPDIAPQRVSELVADVRRRLAEQNLRFRPEGAER